MILETSSRLVKPQLHITAGRKEERERKWVREKEREREERKGKKTKRKYLFKIALNLFQSRIFCGKQYAVKLII